MAEFINTVDVIGDDELCDQIIMKTVTEFKDDTITSIGNSVFYECNQLLEVDCPEVSSIGSGAFNHCDNLVRVNAPAATKIKTESFNRCISLVEVNLPNLTEIEGAYAFFGCTSLVQLDLPNLTKMDQYSNGVFQNCGSLTSVNLPQLTIVGMGCFSAHMGSAPIISILDLPSCTWIGFNALSMPTLECLILRATEVCALNNVNALNNTKIKNGTGYIYVPSVLVDSYKVATNWSTYATQFRALEDYTVDGTTTGELDESKI